MPGVLTADPEQALAHMERRYGVAEADLNRPGGPLAGDLPPQRLPLGGARRDGEEVVGGAVRARHGRTFADQPLDGGAPTPSLRTRGVAILRGLSGKVLDLTRLRDTPTLIGEDTDPVTHGGS